MRGFLGHMHRQEGVYSVMALMLIAWVCIPLALVLIDAGRGGSAASQATGMSYNLAYTSASRAVDPQSTGEIGVAQLSYKDGAVESDAQTVLDYQGKLASISSGGLTQFSFSEPSPGLESSSPAPVSSPPQLSLVNIGFDNRTATLLNGVNRPCGGGLAGGNISSTDTAEGTSNVCWTDQRTSGQVNRGAYEHFSTGSQVRVYFTTPSIFGSLLDPESPNIDGVRTGVAVLARPCKQASSTDDCRL